MFYWKVYFFTPSHDFLKLVTNTKSFDTVIMHQVVASQFTGLNIQVQLSYHNDLLNFYFYNKRRTTLHTWGYNNYSKIYHHAVKMMRGLSLKRTLNIHYCNNIGVGGRGRRKSTFGQNKYAAASFPKNLPLWHEQGGNIKLSPFGVPPSTSARKTLHFFFVAPQKYLLTVGRAKMPINVVGNPIYGVN